MHGVTIDGLIMSRKGDSEVGTSEANIVATRPDAHQKEAATMTIVAMVGTTLGAITSDIDRTAPPTMVVLSCSQAAVQSCVSDETQLHMLPQPTLKLTSKKLLSVHSFLICWLLGYSVALV